MGVRARYVTFERYVYCARPRRANRALCCRIVWEAFAQARGGTLRRQSSWIGEEPPLIDLVVGACLVRVEPESADASPGSVAVSARWACPPGPKFRVEPRGSLAKRVMAFIGVPDVGIGVPSFDEPFASEAVEIAATRFAWTEKARAVMSALATARVEADDTTVTVRSGERVAPGPKLDAMIELAVELSACGTWTLRELAAQHEGAFRAEGTWDEPKRAKAILPSAQGAVTVSATLLPLLAFTFTLRRASMLEPRTVRLPNERSLLPPDAAPFASELGAAELTIGRRSLRLVIGDAQRAPAAIALLEALCRAHRSRGIFR